MSARRNLTDRKQRSIERVIGAAVNELLEHGDELSIGNVAASARCSTSTIYEVFGSKERLVSHVLHLLQNDGNVPVPVDLDSGDAFAQLVDFLLRRIRHFGTRETSGLLRALSIQSNRENERVERCFADRDPYDPTVSLVASAMDAGMIEPCDPQIMAHVLISGASFEPLMTGLLLDERVDAAALVRTVMGPHLTAAGAGHLREILPVDGEDADAALDHGPQRVVGAHRLTGKSAALKR